MDKQNCFKCGHEWLPRTENPRSCPNCKCRTWDIDGYTKCEVCERNFIYLHTHHKDKNQNNNNKNNLIRVCSDCHGAIHQGIGRENRKGIRGGKSKRKTYKIKFKNKKGKREKEGYIPKVLVDEFRTRSKIKELRNLL